MKRSDDIAELAAALAAAQGAMDHAAKDRSNPHFKSRYADLASVVDACRPALAANGIAIIQPSRVDGAIVEVETMLVHKSGQWISETLASQVPDAKAQTIGSAITYLRRYGLSAMAGVAPDDDDGTAASRPRSVESEPTDEHRAEAQDALAKMLKRWPEKTPEIRAAYASERTAEGALTKLRRLYTRYVSEHVAKPVVVARSSAEQADMKRIRAVLEVLERASKGEVDGVDRVAGTATLVGVRDIIDGYGGLEGVANTDVKSLAEEVEAAAERVLAP